MRFIVGLAAASMALCLGLGTAHADRREAPVTEKSPQSNPPGDRQIRTAEWLKPDQRFEPTFVQERAVVLVNETPPKKFAGKVGWRFDPSKGVVYAALDFPELNLKVHITFEPNTDQSLPASHTAEVNFITQPDSPGGGVAGMGNIAMKSKEDEVGVPPLAGSVVAVTNGIFLIGLTKSMRQGNLELLKNRAWFQIPITFATRQRALISFEKGASGNQVLNDAFAKWGD